MKKLRAFIHLCIYAFQHSQFFQGSFEKNKEICKVDRQSLV